MQKQNLHKKRGRNFVPKKFDIKVCLIKNGYPPQYTPEVFREVMEQVENFKENEPSAPMISYAPIEEETGMMMAAEDIFIYGSIPARHET